MIERRATVALTGTGCWSTPVRLGHARQSIIDLAEGQQPIHNEDRTVWIVLNGEILNYVELRRDLEPLGHRIYPQSDTEVILFGTVSGANATTRLRRNTR